MDPENLRGGNSGLLLRLLDDESLRDSDRKTIEKWTMDKEVEVSSSNRIRTMDEEIELLLKAKVVALHSRENLQTEITQREVERNELEMTLLKAIALKKMNKMKVLQEEKDAFEFLLEKQKQSNFKMKQHLLETTKQLIEVQKQLAEKDEQLAKKEKQLDEKVQRLNKKDDRISLLFTRVLTLATKSREKDSDMTRKLVEKELLMDLTLKKDQADKLKLKEAHNLECDALRLQVLRLAQAAHAGVQAAHAEAQAEGRHEPSSTGITEGKNMNAGCIQTLRVAKQEDRQAPRSPSIRLRDNGRNVAPDVPVSPRGSRAPACEQQERKREYLRATRVYEIRNTRRKGVSGPIQNGPTQNFPTPCKLS